MNKAELNSSSARTDKRACETSRFISEGCKVAVTGGGGFVGRAITMRLRQRGVSVRVIGRSNYPDLHLPGVSICNGDIRDKNFLANAFAGCDAVFHVAAKAGIWGKREEYYAINVTGTANVLEACRTNQVPALVYTSTPSVVFNGADLCGGDESLPYAETFLCHYAETKMLAEKMVLAANSDHLKTVALRPHLIWGPGDTNLVPRLIERGRKGLLKRVGEGANLVDISYIDNVVDAQIKAAADLLTTGNSAGKPYFISQGEPVNLWDWINEFYKLCGVPAVSKSVSFKKARFVGGLLEKVYGALDIKSEPLMTRFLAEQLAHSHWFSIASAKNDFGYAPAVTTREGMKRTAAWVKNVFPDQLS
ncbi:MAG: NAD-dependent epimerase/dehydratase family protein [Proteobacteria bacterium]|nr:NAD-dependent epimerase/dehydratase family protein [Pseudomonadota bacterium]MBU1738191.1 NAD-dependent epimerase/dehydratase family protein [Pseudomonadota bacterium]